MAIFVLFIPRKTEIFSPPGYNDVDISNPMIQIQRRAVTDIPKHDVLEPLDPELAADGGKIVANGAFQL